ncbi:copper homeostasis protein CutC [Saccharothrix hoggarensis]|uniref:Copper homeostasis protein cutC homolog n=1 Tax=Saccharothrix hoggarensis TaxID=913853 RepID=A0ABW3R351_9PSEU
MLEVIALDAVDAVAAQEGGADRVELAVDMGADGLTPPVAVLRDVLSATDLPVRVMLRDGPGFAPRDLDGLRRDAAVLREAGAGAFVFGFLDGDGRVDVAACAALAAEVEECAWTFHRALDNSADPEAAWAVVGELGCDTVLAAGSPRGVADGFPALERLAGRQAATALLVGGGLKAEHVPRLKSFGVTGFHVGGAVRPGGWGAPVSADAVRGWVRLVQDPVR